jgi:hypothetical protein
MDTLRRHRGVALLRRMSSSGNSYVGEPVIGPRPVTFAIAANAISICCRQRVRGGDGCRSISKPIRDSRPSLG